MPNPESGSGWEIRRNFVDKKVAKRAARQAMRLIGEGSEYITKIELERPGQKGLKVYQFNAHDPEIWPDFPNTIRNDKKLSRKARDLLSAQAANAVVNTGYITTGYIHVFEPGGHTRLHRDKIPGSTNVLSILGLAELVITDPLTMEELVFALAPGDAMFLQNPESEVMRPLHQVTNIGEGTRISLVS